MYHGYNYYSINALRTIIISRIDNVEKNQPHGQFFTIF